MPIAQFGQFLRQRKEFIRIDDLETYKRARVQLHWKGIVVRDSVQGASIKTKHQQVAKTGELLVAEIDAKVGGIGIVPPELDGAVVSSHYFLFEIDQTQCLNSWLDYYIRSGALGDQIAARGSTNYAAIRPHHILQCKIPLPPLSEQRRIVARIEELSRKIEEARELQQRIQETRELICRTVYFSGFAQQIRLSRIVRLRETDVKVDPQDNYDFAGVYCFGRGVFKGVRKAGSQFAYSWLTRLRKGNFLYPKLMAWEGALGIVPSECDGLVVSPEFPVFELDERLVLPDTLDVYFRMPSVWQELASISTGTNVRRRRLHPAAFLDFEIPLPDMETQLRLRSVRKLLNHTKTINNEIAKNLNALASSILSQSFT